MIITYFGKEFFKISQGDLVLATNPISKKSKEKSTSFGADIALVSTNHPDYNGIENLSYGDRIPFIIDGPGDYEIKDIFIKGALTPGAVAGKEVLNTIYTFTLDSINVAFLGTISTAEIPKEVGEAIEELDILFMPMNDSLSVKDASKLASNLNAKIIIPMNHTEGTLKAFIKEMGSEKPEVLDKLTIKKRDLDDKDGEIIVLKY